MVFSRRVKLFFAAIFVICLSLLVVNPSGRAQTIPVGGVYLPLVANVVPTLTPTPIPLTKGVEVKSSRGFVRPNSKYFRVDGEVINKTSNNAYAIKIRAKFFDAAHQLLDETIADTYLDIVSPQHVDPFELLSSKSIGLIAS